MFLLVHPNGTPKDSNQNQRTKVRSDVVQWLIQHVGASDVAEAVNLASRIASMGYLFCIDDHVLTVKNDSHTYYRFQTPFLYPSRCMEADTVDYAVYLCKRTMQNKQRLELAGFEAERLASLQTLYCHKWEFVYIQAEAEAKVDKKRDKLERLVLDSQERAYWDVHRPPPGCVNTTDVDMRKLCRAKRPKKTPCRPIHFPIPSGPGEVCENVECRSVSEMSDWLCPSINFVTVVSWSHFCPISLGLNCSRNIYQPADGYPPCTVTAPKGRKFLRS
ncbi:unnamed protein product [Echinostoma caproni]|uniref:DEP domain-containing protein n=1 Tax=Echinostoma caproni TaxID=27848 RepID=A0A3P8I9V2_9TREM|nr:unnamed protein product [Echinostoma caproni]